MSDLHSEVPSQPVSERYLGNADLITSNRFDTLTPRREAILKKILGKKGGSIAMAGALFLASVGCGNTNANKPVDNFASPTPIEDTGASTLKSLEYEYPIGGIRVVVDKNGVPIKYKDQKGGEFPLNRDEMLKARQKAIDTKEPEIAKVIREEIPDIVIKGRPDEILQDLPKDVVPENELARKGVTIIQPGNTHLYVREEAFGRGAPLEQFNATGRKLKIVLVNGPVVSSRYMSDSRYSQVRGLLGERDKEVEEHKAEMVKQTEQALADAILRLQQSKGDLKQEESAEMGVLALKLRLYELNTLTTEQLLARVFNGSDAAGFYLHRGYVDGEFATVIFVSVGRTKIPDFLAIVAFDSKGKLLVSGVMPPFRMSLEPNPEHSYPNPKNFPLDPNASPNQPKSYPYAGQTPGFVLLHELYHDKLIGDRVSKGLSPIRNEYETDMGAMKWIEDGFNRWERSGRTDSSGYYFMFRLPHQPGYIVSYTEPPAARPENT